MQHPHILPRHDVDQLAGLDVPNFNKARLEGQNIRVMQRKSLRCALPLDFPVGPRPPTVPVDEETEIGIVEQELAVQPLDMDRLDVFFPRYEIE